MGDAAANDEDTTTTPGDAKAAEEEEAGVVPSRTTAGIERREREKPIILGEIPDCLAFFGAEPGDWQIRRELRGLDWSAGERAGTLLKAAALWLPGEPGAVAIRCVRLRTNVLTRRGVAPLIAGLDPVYATRGPGSATLVELDLAENALGSGGVVALCDGVRAHKYGGLERLDVSGNKCGREGGAALAQLVRSEYGVNLNCLLAARNNMYDEGVGEIGKVGYGRLELLDVRSNFFGARGAAALANGFKDNDTLTALNIKDNIISLEGLWALGNALKNKKRAFYRGQERLKDKYETVPKKERWKVIAERDGWSEAQIEAADVAPPLRRAGEDKKDYVKRRLSQINKDRAAPPPADAAEKPEFDPLYGKRKENLVLPDTYQFAPYAYDVYFFGMDIKPRPLFRKVFGHHIIGAMDSVLCSIS